MLPSSSPTPNRVPTPFFFYGEQESGSDSHIPFNVPSPGPPYPHAHVNPLRAHPFASTGPTVPLTPLTPATPDSFAMPTALVQTTMPVMPPTPVTPDMPEDHPMQDAQPLLGPQIAHYPEAEVDTRGELFSKLTNPFIPITRHWHKPHIPLATTRQSEPLYGRVHVDNSGTGKYHCTNRFRQWLQTAHSNTETDDYFHQWLHRTDGSKPLPQRYGDMEKELAKTEDEERHSLGGNSLGSFRFQGKASGTVQKVRNVGAGGNRKRSAVSGQTCFMLPFVSYSPPLSFFFLFIPLSFSPFYFYFFN